MNMWQEMAHQIVALDGDPQRIRKIQGIVKRFVHGEKSSVYHRTYLHYRHQLSRTCKLQLQMKYKQHQHMAQLPDEKVLTWEG